MRKFYTALSLFVSISFLLTANANPGNSSNENPQPSTAHPAVKKSFGRYNPQNAKGRKGTTPKRERRKKARRNLQRNARALVQETLNDQDALSTTTDSTPPNQRQQEPLPKVFLDSGEAIRKKLQATQRATNRRYAKDHKGSAPRVIPSFPGKVPVINLVLTPGQTLSPEELTEHLRAHEHLRCLDLSGQPMTKRHLHAIATHGKRINLLRLNNTEFTPKLFQYLKELASIEGTFPDLQFISLVDNPALAKTTCRILNTLSSKDTFRCFPKLSQVYFHEDHYYQVRKCHSGEPEFPPTHRKFIRQQTPKR